jgi:hypothetical protein
MEKPYIVFNTGLAFCVFCLILGLDLFLILALEPLGLGWALVVAILGLGLGLFIDYRKTGRGLNAQPRKK